MRVKIVAFTAKGCVTAREVAQCLDGDFCEVFSKTTSDCTGTRRIKEAISEWTGEAMASSDALIFVGATGVAVRMIAPFIKDKRTDPAIVCMDDNGKFVISLLSGHVGGANRLAYKIASKIGGTPVITTATDVNGKFAVDVFATDNGMMFKNKWLAKEVSARILDGRDVMFQSEFPIEGPMPAELKEREDGEMGILISSKSLPMLPYDRTLVLVPKHRIVGVGCKRDTPFETVFDVLSSVFRENNMSMDSIRMIASIDLKADEPALMKFSVEYKTPLIFYTSAELNAMKDIGYSKSDFVKSVTDVDCVCERAAMKASKKGDLVCKKVARNGVTVAVVEENFTVRFGEVE